MARSHSLVSLITLFLLLILVWCTSPVSATVVQSIWPVATELQLTIAPIGPSVDAADTTQLTLIHALGLAVNITLAAGGDLQAAINAAVPGDNIILEADADYTCDCRFPVKPGNEYITIQSSRAGEIVGRVGPAQAQLLARVNSTDSASPTFATTPGSHHFRLVGLEIRPNASPGQVFSIISFGSTGIEQNTLAQVPHHFELDESWVHPGVTQESQRGVALNSAFTNITNSTIEAHGFGYDTQAICGWNGPGPFNIINNHLLGAGENVMFGGSPPAIPGLTPADIQVRQNFVEKPLSWYVNDPSYAGIHWSVKNLFELKNARRVVIDANVFANNWTDGQAGRAIVFTPRPSDSGLAAVIEDVQFTNNIVKNVGSGVLLLGADEPPAPTDVRLRRVSISNNLFDNINGPRFGSNGAFLTVINATEGVTVEHNTAFQTGNIIIADYLPNTGFIYRNNITRHNDYGIIGSGHSIGNDSIAFYFPGSTITANLIAREFDAPWNVDLIYPPGNYYPASFNDVGFVDLTGGNLRLAAGSPYKNKGTDGKDIGCDFDALDAAMSGQPTPTPTPTATPTPTPTVTPTPTPTPSPSPLPACKANQVVGNPPVCACPTMLIGNPRRCKPLR